MAVATLLLTGAIRSCLDVCDSTPVSVLFPPNSCSVCNEMSRGRSVEHTDAHMCSDAGERANERQTDRQRKERDGKKKKKKGGWRYTLAGSGRLLRRYGV